MGLSAASAWTPFYTTRWVTNIGADKMFGLAPGCLLQYFSLDSSSVQLWMLTDNNSSMTRGSGSDSLRLLLVIHKEPANKPS